MRSDVPFPLQYRIRPTLPYPSFGALRTLRPREVVAPRGQRCYDGAMSELIIEDLSEGRGDEAKAGQTVSVHYTGTLEDGSKFDSSLDRNQPFDFVLGAGQVIKGWDQGVAGMKVGGQRKLIIPPDMGYGARGFPPVIPPNSTLHFTVQLLAVK